MVMRKDVTTPPRMNTKDEFPTCALPRCSAAFVKCIGVVSCDLGDIACSLVVCTAVHFVVNNMHDTKPLFVTARSRIDWIGRIAGVPEGNSNCLIKNYSMFNY